MVKPEIYSPPLFFFFEEYNGLMWLSYTTVPFLFEQ